jgi:hypothetical protein
VQHKNISSTSDGICRIENWLYTVHSDILSSRSLLKSLLRCEVNRMIIWPEKLVPNGRVRSGRPQKVRITIMIVGENLPVGKLFINARPPA